MTLSFTEQPVLAKPRKRRKNTEFWRACGYLGAYRKLVITSIICAFFVGLITTGGLVAMLPIFRVLFNHDTVQSWADRQVVARRLGVTFSDDPGHPIVSIASDKRAAAAGFRIGDVLPVSQLVTTNAISLTVPTSHGPIALELPSLPSYFAIPHFVTGFVPVRAVGAVAVIFLFVFLLSLLGSTVRFFQEYLSDKVAINAINDIRRHLYDAILHTPLSFFNTKGTSDVTSRLVTDSQMLQDGFKTLLGQSVQEPIKAGFMFLLALWLSWKLTLIIVLFAPVMFVSISKFGKKMRRASRAAMQRSSDMLGQIEGTLIGIRVVKAATAERFERRRYSSILSRLREEQLKMARYEAWATPTIETIAMAAIGVIAIIATYEVTEGHPPLDPANFLGLFACLVTMGESLRRVSKVNTTLQRSNASAARIFEIIDLPMERRSLRQNEKRKIPRIKIPAIRREIAFEGVTFSYPNAPQPAVEDVSLIVPKGAGVAIVGRNGSGKTTLLALLPRFYDPQAGSVKIDGVDVRDATLRSVRTQIGIVTQDSVIFPGTIAANIAYGLPNASRNQIIDAAKRAFCDDFINQKPQGYDTPLDGLGGQLSGGQRQRLNIARAILRQSPILILDEATSQVDAESEHLIQKAIESMMHAKANPNDKTTTFVIAHRFSTILSADTIVVMDAGRIVGQGKHDDLLRNCPTYKQLYERQLFAA